MNSNVKKFTVPIFLFTSINAFSQDVPELITDRPDRTESATSVPAGLLQIETGLEFLNETLNDESELSEITIAGTLLRYGLIENLELRLAGAFLSQELRTISEDSKNEGLSDLMVGAKYEFINAHETIPDLAILFSLFLPIGAEKLTSSDVEPNAVLSLSKSATNYLDIGCNIGIHYNSSDQKSLYFYTLAAGFGITEEFGAFTEIFSEILSNSSPFYSINAGFTYLLLNNLQLDISGGNGFFNSLEVWYFGAGFSIRIPR